MNINLDSLDASLHLMLVGRSPEYVDGFLERLRLDAEAREISSLDPKTVSKELIKRAIKPYYSDIQSVGQIQVAGGTVSGYFSDSKKQVLKFEISEDGKISYRLAQAIRSDRKRDECKKGIQCGESCQPRGSECEGVLSDASKKLVDLAVRTWETEQIPSRREIAGAIGQVAAQFIRNPMRAIREGQKREQIARQIIESKAGYKLPAKTLIASHLLKQASDKMDQFTEKVSKDLLLENPDNQAEVAVAIGGTTGSMVGSMVGGLPGQVTGDLVGGLAARKGIRDYQSYRRAKDKLKDDEAFAKAGRLKKAIAIRGEMLSEMRSEEAKKKAEEEFTGDVAGWALGNTYGSAIGSFAAIGPIPIVGPAAGAVIVPAIVKAKDKLKEGKGITRSVNEAVSERNKEVESLTTAPARAIREGDRREEEMRAKARNVIKNVKQAAQVAQKARQINSAVKTGNQVAKVAKKVISKPEKEEASYA